MLNNKLGLIYHYKNDIHSPPHYQDYRIPITGFFNCTSHIIFSREPKKKKEFIPSSREEEDDARMTKKNWSCSVRVESVLSFRRLIKARQGGGIPPILWLCAYNYRGFLLWYPGHRFRPGWKRLSCCVLSLHFYVPTCLREYLPHTLYNDQRPAFLASASLFLGLIVAYLGSSERYFGGTKLISGRGENRSGCVGEERILGSLAARS